VGRVGAWIFLLSAPHSRAAGARSSRPALGAAPLRRARGFERKTGVAAAVLGDPAGAVFAWLTPPKALPITAPC